MIDISRRALWGMVIATAPLLAVALGASGLSLHIAADDVHMLSFPLFCGVALFYPRLQDPTARRLAAMIEAIALFSLISMLAALWSYVIVANTHGFTDDRLAAMDRALGFDWIALYRFVAARPHVAAASRLAYLSIFVTPIVVLGALAWTGALTRLRAFLLAFMAALAMTLAIFPFFPAQFALVHHVGLGARYIPTTGIAHVAIIDALRSGAMRQIDPGNLAGLITFPSVHMIAAIQFVWAGWPVRRLRPALIAVNGAMTATIPVEGTHYLVDMIAGAAVAVTAIALVNAPRLRASLAALATPQLSPAFVRS